jgi:hypothetical protein
MLGPRERGVQKRAQRGLIKGKEAESCAFCAEKEREKCDVSSSVKSIACMAIMYLADYPAEGPNSSSTREGITANEWASSMEIGSLSSILLLLRLAIVD